MLLDAVSQVTGVEEKFAGVPAGYRAIELWDSDVKHYFLKLFGRPVRKTACECERVSEPSVSQVLHLMNSPRIHAKLTHEGGRLARLVRAIEDDDALVSGIYLTCYTRFPSAEEGTVALEYLRDPARGRRQAVVDLMWSLINSLEFVFNH